MPTVAVVLSNRVVIYLNDHRPAHVHVLDGGAEAVFDLRCPMGPPELRENDGYSRGVVRRLKAALQHQIEALCGKWSEVHGQY